MKYLLITVILVVELFLPGNMAAASTGLILHCDVPYYLAQPRESVAPQEKIQIRIVVDNWADQAQKTQVTVHLPEEILPLEKYDIWRTTKLEHGYLLQTEALLQGGYGQWLDLLTVQVAPSTVARKYAIQIRAGEIEKQYNINIGQQQQVPIKTEISVLRVSLPLDKDGKKDERLNENTLVLRDKLWDRIRDLVRGKGASNQEAEAMHPLAYMEMEIANPATEQKPIVLISRLLDFNTRRPMPGLVTPSSGNDDLLSGGKTEEVEGSRSFVVLNGERRQSILLPLYTEERLAVGGEYWLQTVMDDGTSDRILAETKVVVSKKNTGAIASVCFSAVIVLFGILFGCWRLRFIFETLKTRWLITIALFGTATFACVNVPSTLLGDFFHILLGPFSFLVTGIFSGVFLYMLLIALFTLIPRTGVISLVMAMRLLLGMLAFGHITLPSLISYGLQAIGLEIAMYYFCHNNKAVQHLQQDKMAWRHTLLLAFACGIADSITTYINMQSMIVLYRLHYANWYIYLVVAFNGMIYTVIGVICGSVMGRTLQKIKGA